MALLPEGVDRQELYVVARRVLLNALEGLADQLDALTLVGAQAVYLRAGNAYLSVAVYTADADLSINRNLLQGVPLLEKAMRASGFELDQAPGRRQPAGGFSLPWSVAYASISPLTCSSPTDSPAPPTLAVQPR